MALHEAYAVLQAAGLEKVVVILDASESATAHQTAIITLVRHVLSALPARIMPALYFLGNPTAYAPHHFASQAGQWFLENRQRASLITPVWETFDSHAQARLVIIGSGRIFDLADWEETPLMRHTLLVSLGEPLHNDPTSAELVAPTGQELCQRLYDPVVSVAISGPGFMPTWWDNTAYQLRLGSSEARLVAEHRDNYAVAFKYFVEQGNLIEATVTHASGAQRTASPMPGIPAEPAAAEDGLLTTAEADILHRAVQKESFLCLHCAQQHAWHTLRCFSEGVGILGECVYPSLQVRNVTGFVVFRRLGDQVYFTPQPGSVLCLGAGIVAVRQAPRAVICRYDTRAAYWACDPGALEPYHPLGEEAYAIVL